MSESKQIVKTVIDCLLKFAMSSDQDSAQAMFKNWASENYQIFKDITP